MMECNCLEEIAMFTSEKEEDFFQDWYIRAKIGNLETEK